MTGIQPIRSILLILFSFWVLSGCGIVLTSTDVSSPAVDEDLEVGAMLQTGVASWYGPKFHGRTTANGETYNMEEFTAAHRTLPFNTLVRVTNLTNGKSVDVRINDRGPYVDNRVIDLSRKAAETIDMKDSGTAEVEIYLLKDGDRQITEDNLNNIETFTVQLGSFSNNDSAQNFAESVRDARVEQINVAGQVVYRVYFGVFRDRNEAERALQNLRSEGHEGFIKQLEN